MKKFFTLLSILLIALVGFYIWKNIPKAPVKQNPMAFRNMEVEVRAAKIRKNKIQLFKELPARVTARKIAEVKPQVSGIIKKRLFIEGQKVEEGQDLYEIDQTLFKIALSNARTNYRAARANYKRLKFLLKEEAVSKKEYDDAKKEFSQARAELKNAQTNLSYTKVKAPISGYISKSNITEGNLVTANQSVVLTTITQLDPIFVDIVLPSKNFLEFKDQKEIAVSLVIDGVDYDEIGTLKFSEVFTNQTTDSVKLRAEFSNKSEKLLPGMFVRAKLHLKPFAGVTVLQKATTRNPDGSLSVMTIDTNNIAHLTPIKTDGIFNHSWIVKSGLKDGDLVIIEGYQKTREGSKVKAIF